MTQNISQPGSPQVGSPQAGSPQAGSIDALSLSVHSATQTQLAACACQQVTLPTTTGQITILAQHKTLITVLKAGDILWHDTAGQTQTLSICGGVAHIQPHQVVVLAD